jgi:methionyl-tRNA formyltransferase
MKKLSEPIIFFGSGPVAAESLQSLSENFSVAAVVTKAAPPHHHGQAPVVKLAEEKSLKIYYVRDNKDLKNLFLSQKILSDIRLGVLVDFGIIVPSAVINYFKLGIINSHFSLLPQWRGADPITFAILSGQEETGVSLMVLVEAMDEGPLLAQERYKLTAEITTPELTKALIELSNSMLLTFLPMYVSNKVTPTAQNTDLAPTYSRKLAKEDGRLEWGKSAEQLEREIRAFAGWPKSHTTINNISVTITRAHVVDIAGKPGEVAIADKQLAVHCAAGQSLIIDRLKPAGRNEMSGTDFLRGYPLG